MIFDTLSDHREEWDFDEKAWFSTFYHTIAESKILVKSHDFHYFIRSSGRMRFWWKIMMFCILSDLRGKQDFDEESKFSIAYQIIGKNEILMKSHDFRHFIISLRKIRFWWKVIIFYILSDHREEWDFDEKSWFSAFHQIIAENKILMKIMIFDILSDHREEWDFDGKSWCSIFYHIIAEK